VANSSDAAQPITTPLATKGGAGWMFGNMCHHKTLSDVYPPVEYLVS